MAAPAELLLLARARTNAFLIQQASENERRVADPIISQPAYLPSGGATITISHLLSLNNATRKESAVLRERLEHGGEATAQEGEGAVFSGAVEAWGAAAASLGAHLDIAVQAKAAASNLLERTGAGSAPEAPLPAVPAAEEGALAFLDSPLDPFPAEVHALTKHWMRVYSLVQEIGLLVEERRSQAREVAQRRAVIETTIASMRAHLLHDSEEGAIPLQPITKREEGAARGELAALALSQGRALAAAEAEAALLDVARGTEEALAAQRARLPAAEGTLRAFFEASEEQVITAAAAEMARARAALESTQARIELLELKTKVGSLMHLRRQRLRQWLKALVPPLALPAPAAQGARAPLAKAPAPQLPVGGPPPPPAPPSAAAPKPRRLILASLAALGKEGGVQREAGPAALLKPASAQEARAFLAVECRAQREFCTRVLLALGYSESRAEALEGLLGKLLPPSADHP